MRLSRRRRHYSPIPLPDPPDRFRVLGFSGTRAGLTRLQLRALENFIADHMPELGRHGDCLGADEDFHDMMVGVFDLPVIIHPPMSDKWRAWCEGAQEVLPPKEYLARNDDILHKSDFIVACPRTYEEQRRGSGTWSMIRHALAEDAEVHVIYPKGETVRPGLDAWGKLVH
jgi:hypothetical protein